MKLLDVSSSSKDIGGITFQTDAFPAMAGTLILARVVKTAGGAIGGLLRLNPDSQLEEVGAEVGAAFATVNPNEVVELIPAILANTRAELDGKAIELRSKTALDAVFTGRIMLMFQVIGWVLGVNYRDFTPAVAGNASSPAKA